MTKSKIFLFLLLAFISGVGAGSFFDVSQKAVLVIAIAGLALAAVFFRRGSRLLNFQIVFSVFLILAFTAGVLRFDWSEASSKVLTSFNDISSKVTLLGYLDDEPQRLGNKQRLTLRVKEIRVPGYATFTNEKVLVTANLYPEFEYGDLVVVEGKLESPNPVRSRARDGVASPEDRGAATSNGMNDFDYGAYLAKDYIFSLAYYPKIERIALDDFLKDNSISGLERLKVSMFKKIFRLKKVFEESIERSIAEPNAAFINGILLGTRESIPQDLKEAFNKTGTTHILAISGYNITIIALYVSALFIFFMKRQTAFWFTVLAIILFTILTGASPSVIRAAIMGVLVLLARRESRFYNMTNAIVFAGAAMIALNPKILRLDVGFQLSFMATLGLIYVSPILENKLEKLPNLLKIKENFIATVSAQLMVLPIILYNFRFFSPVSIPANVLILPVVPFTMFLGFVSGLSGLIWSKLGEIVGVLAWLLSGYELSIIKIFSQFI